MTGGSGAASSSSAPKGPKKKKECISDCKKVSGKP